ncbi:hypothetical protein VOLCADRAFT_118259 [Volvox carteri f. nagariensis]|uniref:Uncharacterized protein n=1 Tax=Volvox carteri f. nagariensis TaxID=3068 RepID=D8U323_VOLCA|nr:uncharacterized protein VOLCADRAFT_118259 [Volvox carteri f. nagariensis]EFJ46002.1 hypothetical protein VOLCADRAFT_118259 [Volvox carteri f. nagariensis]|eukprot:XP_002953080.1 hypothetical protein VOLCADRAFT_118259 [Volvox carteri f. nagariensis]
MKCRGCGWLILLLAEFIYGAAASPTAGPVAPKITQTLECRIIQGPTALLAQFVLLCIVLTALLIKRHQERPRRAWTVWLLDVSKQACSAGAGHLCGMAIAVVAHKAATQASECGWYLVVYLMDCTLGITLAIVFHRLMHRAARWRHSQLMAARDREHEHPWTEALLESGNYGDPPNARRWLIQAAGWVTCVVTARLSVGGTVLSTLKVVERMALALDRAFVGQPEAELFTVMVGIPMLLNVGQAWIQDQVLKWSARRRIKRGGDALSASGDVTALPHGGGGCGGGGGGLLGGAGGGDVAMVQVLVPAGRNRGTAGERVVTIAS